MKRSRTPCTPSDFRRALADRNGWDSVLRGQLSMSNDDVLDRSDEEVLLHLTEEKPRGFIDYLTTVNAQQLRTSLENIPMFYFNLFKYGRLNDFVLCVEMSRFVVPQWNILKDMMLRSSRQVYSTERFEDLCRLFTLNPYRFSSFSNNMVLNTAAATNLLQYYGKDKSLDLYSSFFLYEHAGVLNEFRKNRQLAQQMAFVHSLLFPFGCPNAAYYTLNHSNLRQLALDMLKTFAISSIEQLKYDFPNDHTRYNALLFKDTLLSIFLDEVIRTVAINKKIFDTGLLDILPNLPTVITKDTEYAQVLTSFSNTLENLRSLCVPIDCTWMLTFINEKIRPVVSRLKAPNYLTPSILASRFITPLEKLAKYQSQDRDILYYDEITPEISNNAINLQLSNPRRDRSVPVKEDASKEKLLCAVRIYIDCHKATKDTALPYAFALCDELRRKEEVPVTPLSFMESSTTSKLSYNKKFEHLYMLLCNSTQ